MVSVMHATPISLSGFTCWTVGIGGSFVGWVFLFYSLSGVLTVDGVLILL